MRLLPRALRFALSLLTAAGVMLGALLITAPAASANHGTKRPTLIVIGVGGLQWADIHPETTPNMFRIAAASNLGSLTVRTVGETTCPADGWLTMGTGRRTLAPRPESGPVCANPTVETLPNRAATIDVAALAAANETTNYSPHLGALGRDLQRNGVTSLGVGPGAALMLANSQGYVASWLPDIAALTAELAALTDVELVVIDAGAITEPGFLAGAPAVPRAEQVRGVDRTVGQAITALAALGRVEVLLAGISTSSTTAHLTAAALTTANTPSWLATSSTRRDGLIQLTDLPPTVRHLLDVPMAGDTVGSVVTPNGALPGEPAEVITQLASDDAAALVVRQAVAPFVILLSALIFVLLAVGAVVLHTDRAAQPAAAQLVRRQRRLSAIRAALYATAVAPLASFIGSAGPWRGTENPAGALAVSIGAVWLLLAVAALAGPWRRRPLGVVAVISGATAVVLCLDTLLGSPLQWMSPLGDTPIVAGRFYGISNPPFALALTGAIFALAALCAPLVRREQGARAAGVVLVVGALFTALVAAPAVGANVGGTIAAGPGFVALALLLRGRPLSWRKVGVVIVGAVATGVAVMGVFAVFDSLRPAGQQAHLGRFITQVANGEGLRVITRKLVASFTIVGENPWLTVAVAVTTIIAVTVLVAPRRWHLRPLVGLYRQHSVMRAAVIAMLIGSGVAALVNDSGVALPLIALLLAAPLLGALAVDVELRKMRVAATTAARR